MRTDWLGEMNKSMLKYKITCPECEAALIIASPEAAIWERCPSCRLHVWDMDDALMADVIPDEAPDIRARNVQINN